MTDRGMKLMQEFKQKYPQTKGAASNWFSNLSEEDKQEVLATVRDMITMINQAWVVLMEAIKEAVNTANEAFAAFSNAWAKEANDQASKRN